MKTFKRLESFLPIIFLATFNNWLLGYLIDYNQLINGSSISELSANGSPHAWIFRLMDVTAGIILIYLIFRIISFNKQRGLIVASLILGFSTILDAALPLNCGINNHNCSEPLILNIHQLVIPPHAYSSTLIFISCVLIALFAIKNHIVDLSHKLSLLPYLSLLLASVVSVIFMSETSQKHSIVVEDLGYIQQFHLFICSLIIFLWIKLYSNYKV